MIDRIVDIYHGDDVSDWGSVVAGGVVAVIHKASQGLESTDHMYADRRPRAIQSGLLWGAYHFATGDDGGAQADHFLEVAFAGQTPEYQDYSAKGGVLIALDLEHNPTGSRVTLKAARAFICRIRELAKRLPWAYGSDVIAELAAQELRDFPHDPILTLCPLWIARYGHVPVVPPGWKSWTLWQYAAGESRTPGQSLPGLGYVDRSRFDGTLEELRAVWAK